MRDDNALIEAMHAHVKENPEHGFGPLFDQSLHAKGMGQDARLARAHPAAPEPAPPGKRRLPDRIREPLEIPTTANNTWSADFMADALCSGRRFRTFNANDDFN